MFIAEYVSEIFLIGEYLAKLQARARLSRALCAPGQHTAKRRRKCTRQSRFSGEKNLNRLRFDRIMVMGLWPRFLAHPVEDDATNTTQHVRYILRTTTQ